MNNRKLIVVRGVLVGTNYWDVPIRVDVRAYLRFSRWLDGRLRRLVVRWAHVAPPSARGVPFTLDKIDAPVPPTV
jgi:hypothetical protein